MMIFWGFFLGLPLILIGAFALFAREKLLRFAHLFKSSRAVIWLLTIVAWCWTTYEIMTFGANIFREFFVGVPLLGHLMLALAFLYDHFWMLAPLLIYLTIIWMPNNLAMRALMGILMLIPSALFKCTRLLLPDDGFACVHIFILTVYAGAIIGMFGMFYPWRIEKLFAKSLHREKFSRIFGACALALGTTLAITGLTLP